MNIISLQNKLLWLKLSWEIQKADKGNTVVINDKEKYIEGVKSDISDASKLIQLNIKPGKYLSYII